MLKHPPLLHALKAWLAEPAPPSPADDPLSHPALRRMSLTQLADLPFDRGPPRIVARNAPGEDRRRGALPSPEWERGRG